MVYDRFRYSHARAEWGEMFGLSPNDLTFQQLQKIQLEKLIEFIDKDGRIDAILSNTISSGKLETWKILSYIKEDDTKHIPQTIISYNDGIRKNVEQLEKISANRNYYADRRDSFVFWGLLDGENRNSECTRWIGDTVSVFDPQNADFVWWYDKYPNTAEGLVTKILKKAKEYSGTSCAQKMVSTLPEQPLLKHIENIFACDKNVYMYALSNKYTPKIYVVKSLKSISGKKRRVPSINIELSKEMLSTIPPVMRLGVLETLFFHMHGGKVTFKDIQKSEDLQSLLFGAAIKQNFRVTQVINRFKSLYERR